MLCQGGGSETYGTPYTLITIGVYERHLTITLYCFFWLSMFVNFLNINSITPPLQIWAYCYYFMLVSSLVCFAMSTLSDLQEIQPEYESVLAPLWSGELFLLLMLLFRLVGL